MSNEGHIVASVGRRPTLANDLSESGWLMLVLTVEQLLSSVTHDESGGGQKKKVATR